MTTNIDHTINALPLVASALGDKLGVEVRIGGKEAFTDGKVIHLPAFKPDADVLDIVRGYLDHEAAHIRYTDFPAMKAAKLTPVEQTVFNILEDHRVEQRISERFPGCAFNLRAVCKMLFVDEAPDAKHAPFMPPEVMLIDWILKTVRSWTVAEIAVMADAEQIRLDQAYPGLCTKIQSILYEARQKAACSADVLAYAQQIAALLKAQPTEYRKETSADRDEGSDSSPGIDTPSPETDTCSQDDDDSQTPQESILDALNSKAPDLPKLTGDKLAGILCGNAAEAQGFDSEALVVANESPLFQADSHPIPPEQKAQMRSVTAALRSRLQGLFLAQTIRRSAPGRRGRLDAGRIARAAVHDDRLFRRDAPAIATDTAIHILLDRSGSMTGCMETALSACYCMAEALQMPGINVAVTAFPNNFGGDEETVLPLIRHGEKRIEWRNIQAMGMTPLGPALWYVLQKTLPRREPRKVVLVITDGCPDSMPAAKTALKAAQACGVEVYGIGIASDEVKTLIQDSVVIKGVNQLSAALFGLFSRALTRAA